MIKHLLAAIVVFGCWAGAQQTPVAGDWQTPSEKSGYRTTPRYDETMAYLRRVAAAAPGQVKIESFGKTGEGRDLVAVIVSRDGNFDPAALHRAGRPIVLLQNAIHAGEMDGKDACLALLRDMVVTKTKASLLEHAVIVIMPIYNADGHERVSAYNRINQNGPEEMGWRTNAVNLNLNRDYMKADAVETRAFLRLWNRWLPDYFVDNHVTDGADYQYDITYAVDTGPDVPAAIAQWQHNSVIPYLEKSVSPTGHVIGPYISLVDDADPAKGLVINQDNPRFSTGYALVQNRPSLLVEMHMLKDYKTRVTGNYEIMRALLEVINRDARQIVQNNREADAAAAALAKSQDAKFPLRLVASKETVPFRFRGFKFERTPSEISGKTWIQYGIQAVELDLPISARLEVTTTVAPPAAYLVPAQWTDVIDRLTAHGIRLRRTTRAWSGEVEAYRCEGLNWRQRPFEGRHPQASIADGGSQEGAVPNCRRVREQLSFPAGSALVPLDQRAAKVAIHLLEPEAPDSLLAWGFFDAIFEQKEYAEDYVLEKLAREMLAKDAKLKEEFESKLASDKEFAANPSARLNFFFRRSPWWDPRLGLYPVARLSSLTGVPVASK
ncbi:MAG: M14 family metallopeptidase [Acidobacteriales bacterium]|nr:M14 family metallopeptidase [Terriglobales bacterium]